MLQHNIISAYILVAIWKLYEPYDACISKSKRCISKSKRLAYNISYLQSACYCCSQELHLKSTGLQIPLQYTELPPHSPSNKCAGSCHHFLWQADRPTHSGTSCQYNTKAAKQLSTYFRNSKRHTLSMPVPLFIHFQARAVYIACHAMLCRHRPLQPLMCVCTPVLLIAAGAINKRPQSVRRRVRRSAVTLAFMYAKALKLRLGCFILRCEAAPFSPGKGGST